jgi:hypothetical protein
MAGWDEKIKRRGKRKEHKKGLNEGRKGLPTKSTAQVCSATYSCCPLPKHATSFGGGLPAENHLQRYIYLQSASRALHATHTHTCMPRHMNACYIHTRTSTYHLSGTFQNFGVLSDPLRMLQCHFFGIKQKSAVRIKRVDNMFFTPVYDQRCQTRIESLFNRRRKTSKRHAHYCTASSLCKGHALGISWSLYLQCEGSHGDLMASSSLPPFPLRPSCLHCILPHENGSVQTNAREKSHDEGRRGREGGLTGSGAGAGAGAFLVAPFVSSSGNIFEYCCRHLPITKNSFPPPFGS